MENTELIKALRWCGGENNEWCVHEEYGCPLWNEDRMVDECKAELMIAAADALEAADKIIAELSFDNKMLKNTIDADKGVMLDRIRFLEAQLPKDAHWVAVENGHGVCSNCNRQDSIDNMATHCRYCGAKMKGANDEN